MLACLTAIYEKGEKYFIGYCAGSSEAIRLAMRKPPHINPEDIDELEREIEKGKN